MNAAIDRRGMYINDRQEPKTKQSQMLMPLRPNNGPRKPTKVEKGLVSREAHTRVSYTVVPARDSRKKE